MGKTFAFIGAGVLFLISLCFLGYGALALIGSTGAGGEESWVGLGIGLAVVGLVLAGGGAFLVWVGVRGQKTEVVQQVTMKMDLPGQTSVEQMKCQSCGGVITSNDIKIMAGAPVVTCPYCQSTYQMTEEPKW
jgi:hypothetical protein